MFQGNRLRMVGLGSDGSDSFAKGIHLRWHFRASLDFPQYGFDLYRRLNDTVGYSCLSLGHWEWAVPKGRTYSAVIGDMHGDVDITTTRPLTYENAMTWGPSSATAVYATGSGTLTLKSEKPWRSFRLNAFHDGGEASASVKDGDRLVAEATRPSSGSAVETILTADRFDTVVITWVGRIAIYELCFLWLPDDESAAAGTSWTHLAHFDLPKNEKVALGRVADPAPDSGVDYKGVWHEMMPFLEWVDDGTHTLTGVTGDPKPSLQFDAGRHLLLMAIRDSGIARMLGLYHIDVDVEDDAIYDYLIIGNWTKPRSADERWVCYQLQATVPDPVPVPTGLTATPRKWIGGSKTTQTACGLTWDLLDESGTIPAREAVLFNVYRAKKAKGKWSMAVQVNGERAILIAGKQKEVPTSFYVDGPLADGEYRYSVSGIDLFGRESERSKPVSLTLVDLVAPPPPTGLRAALDAASRDVAVKWRWPEHRRQIASDAKEFRVYWQAEKVRPEETVVSEVSDRGDTSECKTELDADGDWTRFVGGWLVNRGIRFRVTAISVSLRITTISPVDAKGESAVPSLTRVVIVTVENAEDRSGGRIVPQASKASGYSGFLLYTTAPGDVFGRSLLVVDWSDPSKWNASYETKAVTSAEDYAATLPALPVSANRQSPISYALIGVGTVDASGNVGAVSVPVLVSARYDEAPAIPSAPSGEEFATRADYYGKSRYTLKVATEADLYYDILRTTDAALCYAAHGRDKKASDLSDDEIEALAADDANVGAFVSIGATGDDASPIRGNGAKLEYTDEFPGTGSNRYVYRVAAYDSAGNRSSLSEPLLVKLHEVTPPRTPVITKLLGGDRQITLQWARNREIDLASYRVYRAEAEKAADDIRGMTLVSEVAAGTEQFTDTVLGLTDYWYRVTAVDESGNASPASAARRARAYDHGVPDEPTWIRAEWIKRDSSGNEYPYFDATTEDRTAAVALEFNVAQAGLKALAQRKNADGGWSNVGVWTLDAGLRKFVLYDLSVSAVEEHVYRCALMNGAGMVLESSAERTVAALD